MTETDQPALFEALAEQAAPTARYADEHALYPCSRCGGRGREDNPLPRWHWRHDFWDPKCRGCHGAGRLLIFVGPCIDT